MGSSEAVDLRFDGKVAVITGAGRGIGKACALALASQGADVVLVSRSADELEDVASAVGELGQSATVAPCDVREAALVWRLFDSLPQVDVVVNAAGRNIPEPFVDVTEEHLGELFSVNVNGVFYVSQAAIRHMRSTGTRGSIVNITSQMGHVGAANRSVYCATKHAVEGLTKAIAVEVASLGIRVNSVAPTFIETSMTRPFFDDAQFLADTISSIPLGRIGAPDDVAAAVTFLASPAAQMITGTSLLVDGGWTAR